MPVQPYASSYKPTPTIDSFSTPPKGSLEYDLDKLVKQQNRKKYYSESMSSHNDLPTFKTPNSPVVAASAAVSAAKVDEKKGFFRSMWDQICTFFWGPSPADAEKAQDSGGSTIGSTPKLAPSGVEWKKTQATLERLALLMEELNKSVQKIQEVAKEDCQFDELTEKINSNTDFLFLKLLKAHNAQKTQDQIANSDEVAELYQSMRKDQETIREAALKLADVDSNVKQYDKIGFWASLGAGCAFAASILLQTATLMAGATGVAAPLAVALQTATMSTIKTGITLAGVALGGISGATKLRTLNLSKEKTAEESKIKIGQHRRQRGNITVKDRVNDDRTSQARAQAAVSAMAQAARSQVEMTRMLQQLSN